MYRIEDHATPYQWARPAGVRGTISWIVVHSPEAAGNPLGTVGFLTRPGKPPEAQTGYHELVADGVVYRMAPPHRMVGHAGVATRIPNTMVTNRAVNNRTVGISIDNVKGKRPPQKNIDTAAERIADLIIELGLPDAGVVLSHQEVTEPARRGRRTDPVGVNMDTFRAAVAAHLEAKRAAARP